MPPKNQLFMWKDYLIANPDLITGGINTKELATEHWNQTGKKSGRSLFTDDFDWATYIAINNDLLNSGINSKESAQLHYITDGYVEGRRITIKDFDWEFYVYYNNHLIHNGITTQSRAIKHWIEYGEIEGLITSILPFKSAYNTFLEFQYNEIYNIFSPENQITLYPSISNNDAMLTDKNLHYVQTRNIPRFKPFTMVPTDKIEHNMKKYNHFILIIDFPCFGGGTSFFINAIISQYKFNTNFLIVRNFKGKMHWYINDEIMLNSPTNYKYATEFLTTYDYKIQKIFINSIIGHSEEFIDFVLNLNKDLTIITHDYSLFFSKAQMYYHEIQDSLVEYKLNLHKFDRIITQHIGNLHTFGKYISNSNNIVVSELPDYRLRCDKIINNNPKFVIGVMGDISDVKGFYVLNELSKMIKNRKDIEIVIFGKAHIQSIKKQFSYHTIQDLNHLLDTHKPNVLLEVSIWPETFSFTLTLAMITGLPILYQNKFFNCTVQRRLQQYQNAYMFDNIQDVSLSWITKKGQKYLYKIKPQIYFPPFWDEYFGAKTHQTLTKTLDTYFNVVIVTSKIYVSNKEFSYIKGRSIYTSKERFNQTLCTFQTIRKNIPNSYIILYDNSEFPEDEYYTLKCNVDYFINIHNDEIVNQFTNESIHKVYGEVAQTYRLLSTIKSLYHGMNIQNIFKITGRYLINELFDYDQYDNEHIIMKRNTDVTDRIYYFTCFYKCAFSKFELLYDTICQLYSDIQNGSYEYEEWETLLPMLLYKQFESVDTLGITQNIAVWEDKSRI